MAIAAEELSPEATAAVSAAAAGRGRRLSREVAGELRRRASTKAKTAASPAKSSEQARPREAGAGALAGRAGGAALRQGGKAISGNFGLVGRVILAFGAFLLALELASYLSGRYFSYSLGKGGAALKGAAAQLDLYPGQSQKLALQKTLPAPSTKSVITL